MASFDDFYKEAENMYSRITRYYLECARKELTENKDLDSFCSAMGYSGFKLNEWFYGTDDECSLEELISMYPNSHCIKEMACIEDAFNSVIGLKGLGIIFEAEGNIIIDWSTPSKLDFRRAYKEVIKTSRISSMSWEDYIRGLCDELTK